MATILPLTALQQINLQAQQAWADSQQAVENRALFADSLKKQINTQNALGGSFIQPLTDNTKDNADVRIIWPDFCSDTGSDTCSDTLCGDLTGAVAPLQSKTYNITQCRNESFSVSETTFAGSFADMQQFIADNQNRKIKNILERLNTKYLIALHANSGFNRGGVYAQNGTTPNGQYEVAAAQYNDTNLITQIIIDAEKSQIENPFILDSGNLYKTYLQARFNQGNDTGKGDAARANFFDITFDLQGFAKAGGVTANSTFVVAPYAMAFVNKNYYDNTTPVYDPTLEKDKWSFTIPGFGVKVDVLHQRVCENGAKNRFTHTWNYRVNYDFLTNPFGCADGAGKIVTGIIEYTKVA